MKGFTTKAIHTPFVKQDTHGALRMPVYDSAAFEYEKAEHMEKAFSGQRLSHSYTRMSNPTVEEFQEKMASLTEANGVIAVSSGMAAISSVLATLAETGSNIVASHFLFGHTRSLFDSTLKQWGLDVKYVDMLNLDQVAQAIDSRTRLVYFESITNPQMHVFDIKGITTLAHRHKIPVVVDGTTTTPYLFKSKDFGVDIEVLSSTKYISGGATSVGGLIIDNGIFEWGRLPSLKSWAEKQGPQALLARLRKEVFRNLGGCLSPHNAYLQSLGLETLGLRVSRSCANALIVASFLEKSTHVKKVHYPGLPSSSYHKIAKSQFPLGFGGLLCFELENKAACFDFMDKLRLIRRATNIHDNKSLVLHPASTIYREYSPEQREMMGIPDTMIRLSIGIEDVDDIIEDIEISLRP